MMLYIKYIIVTYTHFTYCDHANVVLMLVSLHFLLIFLIEFYVECKGRGSRMKMRQRFDEIMSYFEFGVVQCDGHKAHFRFITNLITQSGPQE